MTSAIAKEAPCPVPLIGYARISTEDQTALPQVLELRSAGCVEIAEEQASGGSRTRPVLARVLDQLRVGDTLVVVRIDRLARSLSHLLEIIERLEAKGAHFGVVCGRGRNPTLRLWPTIFSGKIDVFRGDRRSRLISSMTSVAPA